MYLYRLLVLALLVVVSPAQGLEGGEDVIDITSTNWDEYIRQDGDCILVEYFSPTCGYCRAFAPEYAKVGAYLKGVVKIGRVNVVEEKEKWRQALNARGVPHIQFHCPNAEPLVYGGYTDTISVINWVAEKLPVLRLSTREDMTAYMFPEHPVYPTRTLVVSTPAMLDDPDEAAFTPLKDFKERKAIAAIWPVDDEAKWLYPLPTLVVLHALNLNAEYYLYDPKSINFKTLLENVEEDQQRVEKARWSPFWFSFAFFFISFGLLYIFFCRKPTRPKIQFHKQGERLTTVDLTSVVWEGDDKLA